MRRRWTAFSVLACVLVAPCVPKETSVAARPIPTATAHQSVTLRGRQLTYDVTWAETPIVAADGVAYGTVSGTSYVRTGPEVAAQRPVLFVFGGGPGASASELNFRLLGPKRWKHVRRIEAGSREGDELIDNEDTLLDAADLVMIDTPGAGFSRALRPNGLAYFWSAAHDAEAIETYIRRWLSEHGRESSPIYIGGESYGGYRISIMAPRLADLNVAGLLLISPALDVTDQPSDNELPDAHVVFNLPAMAVAAWFHGRRSDADTTAAQVYAEARTFAQTDLLVGLQQGSFLSTAERARLAARMSQLVGLPAANIERLNLRLDPQHFLETLLPGRVVGRLDTRVSGAAQSTALVEGRSKAADDPALGIGAQDQIEDPAVADYLHGIGVTATDPYLRLNLEMNLELDWAYASRKFEDTIRLNPSPRLAALMAKREHLQVLLISGYYDMTTPILAQRYALSHIAAPLERMRMVAFDGGHAVYADDDTRAKVAEEVRALVERRMKAQH